MREVDQKPEYDLEWPSTFMASNLNLIACISVCWFLLAVVIQLDSSWQSQTVYKDSYNWLSHLDPVQQL